MKVRCLVPFTDLKEKVERSVGDVFDVTDERFSEMEASPCAPLVERVEERKAKAKGKKVED